MSENIPKNVAVAEVRKACTQFSDLYFHVAKVLYEHLGEEDAKKLLGEAVANRAVERGKKLAAKAESLSLEKNAENFFQVTDIPFLGWDPAYGKYVCPFAESWAARYDENPWFREFAPMYCDINDTLVNENYTGDTSQRITKNVLRGDETCERVYFPICEKKETE
jgi:hypothetical protein